MEGSMAWVVTKLIKNACMLNREIPEGIRF